MLLACFSPLKAGWPSAPPVDLPTSITIVAANGTHRLVTRREILPAHSSTKLGTGNAIVLCFVLVGDCVVIDHEDNENPKW